MLRGILAERGGQDNGALFTEGTDYTDWGLHGTRESPMNLSVHHAA